MVKHIDKIGISINGTDINELDPNEVIDAINAMKPESKKLIRSLIKSKIKPPPGRTSIPDDYAKEAGRPSIKKLPYMQSENDGYPYLGGGHAPNCDGKKNYSKDIYSPDDICWCMWSSKVFKDGPLWDDYLGRNRKK